MLLREGVIFGGAIYPIPTSCVCVCVPDFTSEAKLYSPNISLGKSLIVIWLMCGVVHVLVWYLQNAFQQAQMWMECTANSGIKSEGLD